MVIKNLENKIKLVLILCSLFLVVVAQALHRCQPYSAVALPADIEDALRVEPFLEEIPGKAVRRQVVAGKAVEAGANPHALLVGLIQQ